jgi:hypothetical protein
MIERQNLTMRMSMRRFTRQTNAFSKKLENLQAAVALHFAHRNLVRVHKSFRVTPAIAANGLSRQFLPAQLDVSGYKGVRGKRERIYPSRQQSLLRFLLRDEKFRIERSLSVTIEAA